MVTPPPGDWGALSRLIRQIRDYLFGWFPDRDVLLRAGRRIRNVIVVVAVAFFTGLGFAFFKHKDLFNWLLAPADGRLSPFEGGPPVFTAPQDPLATTINVAVLSGIALAFPFFVAGLFYIFRPALSTRYQRFFLFFLPLSFALFIAGGAFVYFILLEVSLRFLLNFGEDVAVPLISLPQYMELILKLMFWMGLIFQIPLAMYMLSRMNIISYRRLKKVTPYTIASMMILAGIITPTTDPWTWGFVAGPMILLYQAGLLLAWLAHPDEGNYLWLRSINNAIRWVLRKIRTLVSLPYTVPRWAIRKVLRRERWRMTR